MAEYEKVDENTKEALLKLALGYDYEDKELIADSSGQVEKVKVIKKHVPPNLKALEEVRRLMRIGRW